MKEIIKNSEPYLPTISQYVINTIISCCFCARCCECYKRRKAWVKKYDQISERYNKETDILHVIRLNRIMKFMSEIQMHKNQRSMIKYFAEYQLDEDNLEIPEKKELTTIKELCGKDKFKPEEDMVDKRILYSITGRK